MGRVLGAGGSVVVHMLECWTHVSCEDFCLLHPFLSLLWALPLGQSRCIESRSVEWISVTHNTQLSVPVSDGSISAVPGHLLWCAVYRWWNPACPALYKKSSQMARSKDARRNSSTVEHGRCHIFTACHHALTLIERRRLQRQAKA